MIIRVKSVGIVEVDHATEVEGGDIEIEDQTAFADLESKTYFPIESLTLAEYDDEWFLVARLDIPEELSGDAEESKVFEIENQEEIYRLKAFL